MTRGTGEHGASVAMPDLCVHQLFERQVERTPEAIAVVFEDRRLSYRELDARANQVAHFLIENGVGPESLVGVSLTRRPELVVALLGVWKAGGAYVPLDPAYPADRLSFMVGDAGTRILLTERACKDLFATAASAASAASAGVKIVCLDEDAHLFATKSAERLHAVVAPSNLAYVMYTSGSTGRPKGAMILHEGLVNYLVWAIDAYGVTAGGSVPVHSSIAFDLTVTSLYPALLAGGQIELLPEDVGAQNLVAALKRQKGRNLVKITPAHLDVLTQQLPANELAGLTGAFVIGGENLPAESLNPWRDRAPETRLINEYGPTETVVGCCIHEVAAGDPRNGPVPIGRPIANTQLYILGDGMQPVAFGEMGELYIGGAGVARGYFNRPELSAEKFLRDPFAGRDGARLYRTGDLARQRPDGIFEFLGRVDDQVKVRGYRIELGEIEATLASHPAVQSCAVLAREDTPGNKVLVGYVVARPGQEPGAEELQTFLKQHLPEYMAPSQFVSLAALPLTINGKVDRKALPAPAAAGAVVARKGAAPRNDTERAIAAIWCEVLELPEVGIDADFFDLGGYSLLAIKVLAKMRDTLGVDLPTQTLFEHSTVAALATLVQTDDDAAPREEVPAIRPRTALGPRQVSFAQQQLWLLDQMVPGSPAYNIVDVVPLAGTYDGAALRRALAELVVRHQVLRTAFASADGRLVQVVSPPFEPELTERDLSSASPDERAREWSRFAREQGRAPFDLARLPLFRLAIVHMSATEHRLLVAIHHVIADEWSMELVQKEVRALYAAFSEGRPSPLAPLPIQYADFADWQREWLTGEVRAKRVAYFQKELAGAQAILAMPTDKPRPATPTLRGATETFALPTSLLERLHAVARKEEATLFMLLEAAFAALLNRYTGQDDILVGTPISGRTHTETQGLIGCFLNTVVLRTTFDRDPTFRALVQQTRGRALGAYANSDLPFEQLVAELSPERDAGRTPLFQVMFILHDRGGSSEVSKLSGNEELQTGTSKFDLTLFVSETSAGLEGLIEYSTDLFEAESIRRLCRSYGNLLGAAAADPDAKVSRLPMLAEADRRQLLVTWNATTVEGDATAPCLHDLFARQAAKTPDRVALVCERETLTYAELDRRSDRLARHLTTLGVGPDALVGLLVERSLDMVVGLLGIVKAGGAYVPLDPSFPTDRVAYMIEDSQMRVLVTHRELDAALKTRPEAIVRLDRPEGWADGAAGKGGATTTATTTVTGEHLAYVLYTSGSTGMPKGVGIPHSAIVNFLRSMTREPGITGEDTLLAVTTLSFDIAGLELYLPLVNGAKVVIASRAELIDPHRLMHRLRDSAATIMQATPATWRALLDAGWTGSTGLKALCGGEAFPPALAQSLLPRCRELWNMYGPTETTVWSTVHRVTAADAVVPIGRPIDNTQIYVLDQNLDPVPPGAVGELYIGGQGLARGYLHRPELTESRFVASPFTPGARIYRAGDFARWRSDGRLECLGRTDHQVKLRGYRIELGEIEACIARHGGVRQVVVVAREDTPGDKRLVAYVVADGGEGAGGAGGAGGGAALFDALRAELRAAVPDYMVPAHFVGMSALPLTPNGKVDRKALPAPAASVAESHASSYVAPATELEIGLAAAWQRVLGAPRVGVNDNFFDLGGNSLSVLNLMLEMENTTGIEVSLGALFRFPTIATLLASLGSEAAKDASLVVPLQPEGDGPPIFCLCGISMYQELAVSLGDGQPVFGVYVPEDQELTRQALNGDKLEISVPRLAQAYHDAIVKVCPRGPYRLAGSSFGGIVAIEVASMLRGEGAEVELVALLDTLSPRGIHRNWVKWAYRRAGQLINGEALPKVLRELTKLKDKLVARGVIPGTRDPAQAAQDALAVKQDAYYAAISTWKTRALIADFNVVLFRASDQGWGPQDELDNDYGWRHYLSGPLSVVDVPGDHLGILKAPHVTDLAGKVQKTLNGNSNGQSGVTKKDAREHPAALEREAAGESRQRRG